MFWRKRKTRFKHDQTDLGFLSFGQGLMLVRKAAGLVSITAEGQVPIFLEARDVKDLREILALEEFDVEES
jgi:hypothetical protein